jgi:nucleotide-binding universal stress UspA family protein
MIQRILVPLDQSTLAEAVLPLVADAARGGKGVVRLLHVAPLPQTLVAENGRVVAYADQEGERLEAEALDYLRTIEAGLDDIPIECAVRFGDPANEIIAEAGACGADLIAVATRGRSGLKRAVLGSVAEQVFRRARQPVVLYSATPG